MPICIADVNYYFWGLISVCFETELLHKVRALSPSSFSTLTVLAKYYISTDTEFQQGIMMKFSNFPHLPIPSVLFLALYFLLAFHK